ncbi:Rz-like spanin [Escherichia phage LL5]|uniref:Unimolecular spanin protein n=1 Tax=Escherichia phage LL5 TaxID=2233992 RepID=A0A2Z4Q385_9CAUD|nr:Rz-like spanin [Escherichia phage LL5]AWY04374.1 unimolecular spanin protein [Escherichia phage LL5]
MKWLKLLYPFAVIIFACFIVACSPSSVLPGLIGSKPDITAQAGAENVKQTVGVTAKQDTSSKQETTFKESAVGKVDTSNKKQVSTSSIKADNITAERIEIRNNDGLNVTAIAIGILMFIAGMLAGWTLKRNKAA